MSSQEVLLAPALVMIISQTGTAARMSDMKDNARPYPVAGKCLVTRNVVSVAVIAKTPILFQGRIIAVLQR